MRRLLLPFAVSAVCFSAAGVQAQDYEIKIKEFPDKGKTVSTTHKTKTVTTTKVNVNGMVVKNQDMTDDKTIVYDMTVLETGRRKPAKYKNTYKTATSAKNNQESKLSYHMRTVIFEFKNGKYQVEAEGQPALAPKDLQSLQKQANRSIQHDWSSILLPDKKIGVGDSWKVSPEKLAQGLAEGLPIDASKSSATGTLKKVYDKGNSKFGVIEFDVKLAVNQLGPQKLQTPAIFAMHITADTAIDGSSTEGTLKMDGTLTAQINAMQGGQAFVVDVTSKVQDTQTQSAEK